MRIYNKTLASKVNSYTKVRESVETAMYNKASGMTILCQLLEILGPGVHFPFLREFSKLHASFGQ
jgi:hypothetical protein